MNTLTNYTGNSRWTNSMRGHAVHLAELGQNPLCGKKYQNGASDRPDFNLSEVTCLKCLKIYNKLI